MKQYLLLLVLALSSITLSAQYNLNDYKYVIIEKQFHFQSEPDQYNLNNLVAFEFRKLGFKVLFESEGLPDDLKKDICLALNSEVIAKGALRTKAYLKLINCSGETVYTSEEGITKEKDFARAYQISIQRAFDTMEDIQHNYNETTTEQLVENKMEEKVEALEAEVARLKAEKEVAKETVKEEVNEEMKVMDDSTTETKIQEMKKDAWFEGLSSYNSENGVLYLKQNEQGVVLLNEAQQVVYTLRKTGSENVYIAMYNGQSGVASFNTEANTIQIEFYQGQELKTTVLKGN